MQAMKNQLTNNHMATQLLLDYVYHTQKRDLSHLETAICCSGFYEDGLLC